MPTEFPSPSVLHIDRVDANMGSDRVDATVTGDVMSQAAQQKSDGEVSQSGGNVHSASESQSSDQAAADAAATEDTTSNKQAEEMVEELEHIECWGLPPPYVVMPKHMSW